MKNFEPKKSLKKSLKSGNPLLPKREQSRKNINLLTFYLKKNMVFRGKASKILTFEEFCNCALFYSNYINKINSYRNKVSSYINKVSTHPKLRYFLREVETFRKI